MKLDDVIISGLAVWRISNIIVNEYGPFGIFYRIREKTGIVHDADGDPIYASDNNPLRCVLCTSVWVSIIVMFVPKKVRSIFAVAAITSLLDR